MAAVEPLGLAKLDSDLKPVHALLQLLDVRERPGRRQEPARELKEHCAEPAGSLERLESHAESLPRLVDKLSRKVLQVDVLATKLIRQLLAQVGRH